MSRHFYAGWRILPPSREELLRQFIPAHRNIRCHHVTHSVSLDSPICMDLPGPSFEEMQVYGLLETPTRQVLAVAIDGERYRLDGVPYHITLCHATNRGSAASGPALAEALLSAPTTSEYTPAYQWTLLRVPTGIYVGDSYTKEIR